ncbi:MAG TPA: sigma-70 family RNA polymerase sigma factor [Puia sp.]|nr:sigma-70 family RNA polymerase sigma factor [Puia sp.]
MVHSFSDPQRWFDLLLEGDERALRYFFDRHVRHLVLFTFKITQDQSEAEDIAGKSIHKMWEKRKTLESQEHLRGFLYETARNMAIDYRRRQKREQSRMADLPEAEEGEGALEIEARQLEEIYKRAETLPEECKRIFFLRYKDGLDIQTIANQLKINPKTVSNQLSKAKQILRSLVKKIPFLLALFTSIFTC